jgi:HSP20 family protein
MSLFISLRRRGDSPSQDEEVLFPEAEHLVPPTAENPDRSEGWIPQDEGQLAVDVFDGDGELVVRSAIAGVNPQDLEVFLHDDMLTVRGRREGDEPTGRPILRECHWGSFSRSLILPNEIDPDGITASIREGVLTIHLPKISRSRRIAVKG